MPSLYDRMREFVYRLSTVPSYEQYSLLCFHCRATMDGRMVVVHEPNCPTPEAARLWNEYANVRVLSIRMVAETLGGHIHVAVFAGFNVAARGKCGDLVFRAEEWPAFRDLLWREVEVEERP